MAARGRARSDFPVIAALARGASIAEAAAEGRVSERTVRRWKTDAEFNARLGAVRDDMLSRATGMLAEASVGAVITLRSVLERPKATDAAKIRAAIAILDELPKLRASQELTDRIAALEDRVSQPYMRGVR